MFATKNNFKTTIMDTIDGDGAGVKSVTLKIDGENAYGYFKAEMGVHRLVRISPFDSNKRRHTSFASVEVMPEIPQTVSVEIRPEDLKVDVYRSGGAGGQHVNTTDSAVRITHIPTGIIVACQQERSQIKNRETAMSMLKSKLIALEIDKKMQESLALKGESKKIEWGSQIRSYVFCPYTMVKDHRTGHETSDVYGVMDGNIKDFVFEFLKLIN
jgi:peptide chain release factor 2